MPNETAVAIGRKNDEGTERNEDHVEDGGHVDKEQRHEGEHSGGSSSVGRPATMGAAVTLASGFSPSFHSCAAEIEHLSGNFSRYIGEFKRFGNDDMIDHFAQPLDDIVESASGIARP